MVVGLEVSAGVVTGGILAPKSCVFCATFRGGGLLRGGEYIYLFFYLYLLFRENFAKFRCTEHF